MFTLKLYDRNGQPLKQGDIVKISDGRSFAFFSEVKYLEDEKVIAPFHTFSFHSFEKVKKVPANAKPSTETRYKIWYLEEKEEDLEASSSEKYLADWRDCESLLEKKCFRIFLTKPN